MLPKIRFFALPLAAMILADLCFSQPSFAVHLGGCVNSPENPTLILGLLGGAAAAIPLIRARFLKR